MTYTDDELDALLKLTEEATPGPWTSMGNSVVAPAGVARQHMGGRVVAARGQTGPSDADAAFIAASREAIPRLIAEVRRLNDPEHGWTWDERKRFIFEATKASYAEGVRAGCEDLSMEAAKMSDELDSLRSQLAERDARIAELEEGLEERLYIDAELAALLKLAKKARDEAVPQPLRCAHGREKGHSDQCRRLVEELKEQKTLAQGVFEKQQTVIANLRSQLAERDARIAVLEELLGRIRSWDMLWVDENGKGVTADGPYWQGEIAKLLPKDTR